MMRIVSMIILHTFVAQAHVAEQDFMDQLANKLFDKLADRMFASDLDGTTLAKTHPDMSASMSRAGTLGRAALPAIVPRPAVPPTIGSRPQVRVDAMRGSQSHVAASASPLASYQISPQMQTQGKALSISDIQDTLKSHGFASSPMQKLALTTVAATRDPSMKAQARQVFESMDSKDQKQVMAAAEAVQLQAKDMAGVTEPFGKPGSYAWDPLGFSTGASTAQLLYYRDLELKHGRIGMLAFLGMAMGEMVAPLIGGADVPAVYMWQRTTVDQFWPAVVIASGIHEMLALYKYDPETDKFDIRPNNPDLPGDYNWDPLKLKPTDPKKLLEMQNKEINNGRLAMLAAAGIIAQEQVTGLKIFPSLR